MKNHLSKLIFILLLVIVAFIYDYHKIAFKRPQSVHAWRQSDGASLALNYYRDGMNFFQPQVHNLTSDGGTSGKSATSELPLLYFTVAILYKFFGYHEFIYRLLNTLIFLTGLFYLFKAIRLKTGDDFWAITIPLLFFTSPVLVYYGNNFLTNSTAVSMIFIAWYFLFRYFKKYKKKDLFLTFVFLFLGGALKVTALLSFFALAGVFILEYIFNIKFNDRKLFQHPRIFISCSLITLIPIIGWILYASYYNKLHDTTYFSTTFFPLWSLNPEGIREVISGIQEIWLKEYFSVLTLIIFAFLLILNLLFYRKIPRFILWVQVFLVLQISGYVVLQFWTLKDHDYYTINLYILPVFILLGTIKLIQSLSLKPFVTNALKLAFAVLVVFNIQYTSKRMNGRYEGWMNRNYQKMSGFYNISPHLRQMGITPADSVISFSDFSHVSLYLMDQKGWTRYTDAKFNRQKPVRYNQDSTGVALSIERGAQYLVVNGFEDIYSNEYLEPFIHHLESSYKNILIFNLKSSVSNFNLEERELIYKALCTAERLDTTGQNFLDSNGIFLFGNSKSQSNDIALSGSNSIKLNSDMPYGFTHRIKNPQYGESIIINVWKKGKDSPGVITVQAEDIKLFHRDSKELTGNVVNDWFEMKMEFFVPFELKNKELKVFIYNPEEETFYFDDFRIRRYASVVK